MGQQHTLVHRLADWAERQPDTPATAPDGFHAEFAAQSSDAFGLRLLFFLRDRVSGVGCRLGVHEPRSHFFCRALSLAAGDCEAHLANSNVP